MKTLALGLTALALLALLGTIGEANLTEGLILYVPFDEDNGETTMDQASSLKGAINNGASWVNGKVGSGLLFDGVDDYVDFGEESREINVEEMTAAAWINREQEPAGEGQILLGKFFDPTNKRSFLLWITPARADLGSEVQGGAALCVTDEGIWGTNGNELAQVTSETVVKIEKWVHVAGTYDGSELKIYINGKLDGSMEWTKGIYQGDAKVQIGKYEGADFFQFWGIIDEVMLWDRALSEQEINQVMMSGLAVKLVDKLATTWGTIKCR